MPILILTIIGAASLLILLLEIIIGLIKRRANKKRAENQQLISQLQAYTEPLEKMMSMMDIVNKETNKEDFL